MIKKPEEMTFEGKKIRMLIAGFPGIGKTSLALSAPKPLYIDVDLGAERINREILNLAAGVTQPKDYTELREDLGMGQSGAALQAAIENLRDYETIVIDTGGKLLTIMGQYGLKVDRKYGRSDGSLSLQGYGWLSKEFQRFLDHIIYVLDKHIVVVFHAIEDKDGDETKLRIKAEGSSKNAVWEVMDLGGFMEIKSGQRTIGFSNCERYFAKGTKGINGIRVIPELKPGVKNDFLTRLFQEYAGAAAAETAAAAVEQKKYDAAMARGREILDLVTDADSANTSMAAFKAIGHALTSKRELGALWNAKIKDLGLTFDKVQNIYLAPEEEEHEEVE